jgi:hypothetical protein
MCIFGTIQSHFEFSVIRKVSTVGHIHEKGTVQTRQTERESQDGRVESYVYLRRRLTCHRRRMRDGSGCVWRRVTAITTALVVVTPRRLSRITPG